MMPLSVLGRILPFIFAAALKFALTSPSATAGLTRFLFLKQLVAAGGRRSGTDLHFYTTRTNYARATCDKAERTSPTQESST